MISSSLENRGFFMAKKYFLQKENIPFLKRFYRDFLKRLNKDFINRASKKFHTALQENFLEDRLLNLITALEGLYLPDTSQELKYKLAVRAAIILGKTPKERNKIFDVLRKAYDLRSRIVHCDKDITLDPDIVNKVEEITRNSLKIFIRKPELHNDTELDKLVLKLKKCENEK